MARARHASRYGRNSRSLSKSGKSVVLVSQWHPAPRCGTRYAEIELGFANYVDCTTRPFRIAKRVDLDVTW